MQYYQTTKFDYDRRNKAFDIRLRADELSRQGPYSGDDGHTSNGDEKRFGSTLLASFTKGLPHSSKTGLLTDVGVYSAFKEAIDTGDVDKIAALPLGPPSDAPFTSAMARGAKVRGWESMAAGLAFGLEGPDCQRPTMPPAPQLDSSELAFEMTELYWMSLLRDVRFSQFMEGAQPNEDTPSVSAAVKALNNQQWTLNSKNNKNNNEGQRNSTSETFSASNIFRGSTNGDNIGPYLSQFLLVGSAGLGNAYDITDGVINYGAVRIDQRVRVATEQRDYMTSWGAFVDVQNAADVRGEEEYVPSDRSSVKDPGFRFITTPRDLATYVHYDALYEAYLNACLIMLSMDVPLDDGIPFGKDDSVDKQTGFALFGGPHILTLVTEVATRALKAARFQKFNVHRRPRPEAVAALIDGYRRQRDTNTFSDAAVLSELVDPEALNRIGTYNKQLNTSVVDKNGPRIDDFDPKNGNSDTETLLLPMAFPEGSPMHPSYGAGHATVAGACVTILKAFFKSNHELDFCFVPSDDGTTLRSVQLDQKLTVEGELNKVCSNISIGRNWAGVHWQSDYTESIKVGEEIAIGILEEQVLTYHEKVSMTVPKFNGDEKVISN